MAGTDRSAMMDWDKLRVFHAVAEAGSFTHAGEQLGLSQSAVSRQISGLEESLGVTLFHRHARGLMLTEPGDMLHRATREMAGRLSMTEALLMESRETAKGRLKVTTTLALGTTWLSGMLAEFHALFPDIELTLLLDDDELDLSMREADVAIRLTPPRQPDLIQRHLMTINFHLYASREYLARHGTPATVEQLRGHSLIVYPPDRPAPFQTAAWLLDVLKLDRAEYKNVLFINNTVAILKSVEAAAGIAMLPDFMVRGRGDVIRILPDLAAPQVEARFVYPEELRKSKRIAVFRDFIVARLAGSAF